MEEKKGKKIIVGIVIALLVIAIIGLSIFLIKVINDNKPIYVEEITVDKLVNKFNSEVADSDIKYSASDEYFIAEDGFYWYGLHEDVVLHIVPVKYSEDLKKDIVLESGIFYDKDSKNEKMAMEYLEYLIKANVSTLTDEEIKEILNQAKELGKTNVNTKKGTGYANYGLVVTYWDNEDNYHYSIEREMEPEDEKNS